MQGKCGISQKVFFSLMALQEHIVWQTDLSNMFLDVHCFSALLVYSVLQLSDPSFPSLFTAQLVMVKGSEEFIMTEPGVL